MRPSAARQRAFSSAGRAKNPAPSENTRSTRAGATPWLPITRKPMSRQARSMARAAAASPAARSMTGTALISGGDDVGTAHVELLHQRGTTLEHRALVHVALVGDLVGVDRRRLRHDEQ